MKARAGQYIPPEIRRMTMNTSLKKDAKGGMAIKARSPRIQRTPTGRSALSSPLISSVFLLWYRRRMLPEARKSDDLTQGMADQMHQRPQDAKAPRGDAHGDDPHVFHAGIGQHPLVVLDDEDVHRADEDREQSGEHQNAAGKREGVGGTKDLTEAQDPEQGQFSRVPESRAETAAGASEWASGSQVCMGAKPALVP